MGRYGKKLGRGGFRDTGNFAIEPLEHRRLLTGDTVAPIDIVEAEQKIGELKDYFDQIMVSLHPGFVESSLQTGTDGVRLYNLQLALDGVLSMYEATGDRDTLDMGLVYAQNVVDSADIIEGGWHEQDGFKDWEVTSGGGPRARREGLFLYDFQFGSAMSRLARIIHEDARLQTDTELQAFGDELVQFIDQHIVYKWLDARNQRPWLIDFHDNGGFWNDKATHTVTTCHNMQAVLGDASSCAGIEETLATHFKSLLVLQNDGSYTWDIWSSLPPNSNHHSAPDTSHENRVATMITRLAADGFVFDSTDVQRLSRTFTERIWNGRTDWEVDPGIQDSPWFHNYIDGSDEPYRTYTNADGTEGMSGFVYDGWIRLGEFDGEAQAAGEALLGFVQAFGSNVNAIRQRNGSSYGRVMLAGNLARNLRFTVDRQDVPSGAVSTQLRAANLIGDLDRDGTTGYSDFLVLSANFGAKIANHELGDLDRDGVVGFSDFLILSASFSTPSNP